MSKKNHEDWERTQHYLIRSLFEDVSVPSPVPQEPVSNSSSPSKYAGRRSCSPLPELIIEVEKKVNRHDEPEEFYIGLERRMRKYYRKVMKNREEDFDSSDHSSNKMDKTKCISAASSVGYENTKISNSPRKSSESSPKVLKRETEDSQSSSHGSPVNRSVSSGESSEDNTQTENIRRTSPKILKSETEDSQSSSHGSSVNSSVENSGETSLDGNEDEKSKSDEESIKELEVMRRQHNITSQGSLHNEVRITDILNQSFTADDFVRSHSKSTEQLLGTSAIERSVEEPSVDDFQFGFNRCSTPRISMLSSTSQSLSEENESHENQTETSKKSTNSSQRTNSVKEDDNLEMSSAEASETDSHCEIDQTETSSTTNVGDSLITRDGDTTSKRDCAVQTSPVKKTINWHNFFVGSPKIYDLCHRKNHHV